MKKNIIEHLIILIIFTAANMIHARSVQPMDPNTINPTQNWYSRDKGQQELMMRTATNVPEYNIPTPNVYQNNPDEDKQIHASLPLDSVSRPDEMRADEDAMLRGRAPYVPMPAHSTTWSPESPDLESPITIEQPTHEDVRITDRVLL